MHEDRGRYFFDFVQTQIYAVFYGVIYPELIKQRANDVLKWKNSIRI
jgi:hypothetical protein